MISVYKSSKYILQQETLYNRDIKVFVYGIYNVQIKHKIKNKTKVLIS